MSNTPRQSTTQSSPSKSKTLVPTNSHIQQYLEQHGMYTEKGLLENPQYADFKHLVLDVVDTERPSVMKQKSIDRLYGRLITAKDQNEATLLGKVLPCIIKTDTKVSIEDPQNPAQLIVTDEDFEDSGLDTVFDQEFQRNYMPNSYRDMGFEEETAKALQKYEGVKNPKPDRVYGLTLQTHQRPLSSRVRPNTVNLMEVAPTIHHPFYIIEGKSANGSMTAAQYQACRGGATLVRATRELLEQTGQNTDEDKAGPDQRTYIYSTTMDVHVMEFWVHFALVQFCSANSRKKLVTYHMEHLHSVAYRADGNPVILRRICHNILEWGVRKRHDALAARCAKVWQFENAWFERMAVQSVHDAEEQKEYARQKRAEVNAAKRRRVGELGFAISTSGGSNEGDDIFT
ncbi:MAG: hypothetical protein Q9163_003347 [Psora crenata]